MSEAKVPFLFKKRGSRPGASSAICRKRPDQGNLINLCEASQLIIKQDMVYTLMYLVH